MLPSNPADLVWNAFDPLLQRVDVLHAVTDLCAFYGPECLGLVLSLSTATLGGVVMYRHATDKATRDPDYRKQTAPILGWTRDPHI